MPDLVDYRKPGPICRRDLPAAGAAADQVQRAILDKLEALGLVLRLAERQELDAVRRFRQAHRPPPADAQVSGYELFRNLRYGYCFLIEDAGGRIRGMLLEARFLAEWRTSCAISMAVDAACAGHNLASDLLLYAAAEAMRSGCRIQRGLVGPTNTASVITLFNKVGHLADEFEPRFPGFDAGRFSTCLPLAPDRLLSNRIDDPGLRRFVDRSRPGEDYLLVDPDDEAALTRLYRGGSFKVAAFADPGLVAQGPRLVAVADRLLGLEYASRAPAGRPGAPAGSGSP